MCKTKLGLIMSGNLQFRITQHESNHVHQNWKFFLTYFASHYNLTVTVTWFQQNLVNSFCISYYPLRYILLNLKQNAVLLKNRWSKEWFCRQDFSDFTMLTISCRCVCPQRYKITKFILIQQCIIYTSEKQRQFLDILTSRQL